MALRLEYIFIGTGFFALIIILGLGLYSEQLNSYDTVVDTSSTFGKVSSNLQKLQGYDNDMIDKIKGDSITDETAVDDMVSGGYKGIRNNPFEAMTILSNTTQIIVKETNLGINPAITNFLLFCLGILVVFAIIYMVFKMVK